MKALSSAEVYAEYIVPTLVKSEETETFSTSLLNGNKKKYGHMFGTATVFVIHARQSSFLGLVDSLKSHFSRNPSTFVWVDLFCLENNFQSRLSPHWFSTTLCAFVGGMEGVVVVLDPCEESLSALSRTWCLWELYLASQSTHSKKFEVVTSPSGSLTGADGATEWGELLSPMEQRLLVDLDGVTAALRASPVNIVLSSAHCSTDKEYILHALELSCTGSESVNGAVQSLLLDWQLRAARRTLTMTQVPLERRCVVMHRLALLLLRLEDAVEAESLLTKAASGFKSKLGGDAAAALTCMTDLGVLLYDQGRLGEAEPLHRQVLASRRKSLGDTHEETLQSICSLGVVLRALGRVEEAERLLLEARHLCRALLAAPSHHPDQAEPVHHVASVGLLTRQLTCAHELGVLCRVTGRFEEAEGLLREAVVGRREVLGSDHKGTRESVHHLGKTLQSLRILPEAESLLEEAMNGFMKAHGEMHRDTLDGMHALGLVLHDQLKLNLAEPMLRRAADGYRSLLGQSHICTLTALSNLALLLECSGQIADAENVLREAATSSRSSLGDSHMYSLVLLGNLGELLAGIGGAGRTEEAESLLRLVAEKRSEILGEGHLDSLSAVHKLAAFLRKQKRLAEVEEILQNTLNICRKTYGKRHPTTG